MKEIYLFTTEKRIYFNTKDDVCQDIKDTSKNGLPRVLLTFKNGDFAEYVGIPFIVVTTKEGDVE